MAADNLVFLPQPRELELTGGEVELAHGREVYLGPGVAGELHGIARRAWRAFGLAGCRDWSLTAFRSDDVAAELLLADDLDGEAYRLTITAPIRIEAGTAEGLFRAVTTLEQLLSQCEGGRVPCMAISDRPTFAHRGVMLDISRDKVPKQETLSLVIDQLARLKVNQVQLYTEHTFAYSGHREVWADASPMTPDEILGLDQFCRERYIELVPNQNSFGHMERWLKHDRYRPLAESPDGFTDPWGNRRDVGSTLFPGDPASLDLLRSIYDGLLPHFSSPLFNVGCDEPFELGQGRSKADCEARGVGRVYLDFLLQIHTAVTERGRSMMCWADIILKHPELIGELPDDLTVLTWGYEADHPFDDECAKLAAAGVPFYVCPGTSTWNAILGRADNAMANLRSAAEAGASHGAAGMLITDWGDNGHFQHLPISWPGLAYGAAMAWNAGAAEGMDLGRSLDVHLFADHPARMGQLLVDLGHVHATTGCAVPNATAFGRLLTHPDDPIDDLSDAGLHEDGLHDATFRIDECEARLSDVQPDPHDHLQGWVKLELANACAMARHASRLGLARFEMPGSPIAELDDTTRDELAEELDEITDEFKRCWRRRNRIGGLADSAARLERLLEMYRG